MYHFDAAPAPILKILRLSAALSPQHYVKSCKPGHYRTVQLLNPTHETHWHSKVAKILNFEHQSNQRQKKPRKPC
jgi:hypothetical protein